MAQKKQVTQRFTYEAYDKAGAVVRGEFSAQGRGEVLEHILSQGLHPTRISLPVLGSNTLDTRFFERIETEDTLFFARNLATALRMGVSATEALEMIIADTEKKVMQDMLKDVLASIRAGNSFSVAFAPYKKYFPSMFQGMLEAGEISGRLDNTLTVFADYLERSHEFQGRVRSALLYPTILVVVSIVVSILIIVVMVPRLSRIFIEANIQLPLITRVMVGISEVLTYSYVLDILVVSAVIASVVWFRATKIGSSIIASVSISTPLARDIVRRTILVRITRTLGTLLDSGVSIIEALTLAGKASGNARFQEALARVTTSIVAGAPIADSFTKENLFFPRMLVGLMAVGERTGKLAGTLQSIANFYERDVDERLKRFTALIEPLLLLVLGLVVGAIALSVLLPIYQLVGAVK